MWKLNFFINFGEDVFCVHAKGEGLLLKDRVKAWKHLFIKSVMRQREGVFEPDEVNKASYLETGHLGCSVR